MSLAEMYVIAFMTTSGVEKAREVLVSDPPSLPLKFRLWVSTEWQQLRRKRMKRMKRRKRKKKRNSEENKKNRHKMRRKKEEK